MSDFFSNNMDIRSKRFSIADIFLCSCFLLSLYIYIILYFQGNQLSISTTTESGASSTYKSYSALVITIVSLLFYIKHPSSPTSTTRIFGIFAFYALLITVFNGDNSTYKMYINQFTSMTLWIFVYLFFFALFSAKSIKNKTISKFTTFNTILFFLLFFTNYIIGKGLGFTYQYIESYFCIAMLPFIFTFCKKWKNLLLFIVIAATILAAKRTGMLACGIAIVFYYFLKDKKNTKKATNIIKLTLLLLIALILANQFIGEEFSLIIERFQNISEDDGSGRGTVFQEVFNLIINSSSNDLFFGHGYNTVIETSIGYSAHNDFLEVTYDYGIIGLAIYILFYLSLLLKRKHIKNINWQSAFTCSIIIFLINSIFSHMILFPNSILVLCSFWGIIDGTIHSQKSYLQTT